ncbi:hypothetical protein [Planococcus sp. FY231025]|uniref:hypothetical protein n=1 Tax=Planococcus sp. FY231025 TaxID=3455699 RepID=UPI003F91D98F
MIAVVGTEARESMEESISKLMDAELEFHSGKWRFQKKRQTPAVEKLSIHLDTMLDLLVSFGPFKQDGEAVNQAEIFLLPEELPIFTLALLRHPILFPSSYSQQLSMERGLYCLRIKSVEAPEGFARRLSESLRMLEDCIKP